MRRPVLILFAAVLALAACQRGPEDRPAAASAEDAALDASSGAAAAGSGSAAAAGGAGSGAQALPPGPTPPPPGPDGMTSQAPIEPTDVGAAPSRGIAEPTTHELARPDTPMPRTDPDGRPSL